jgi:exosortase
VLGAGIALRLVAGLWLYRVFADQIALLPCLAGVCLLVGGVAVFRWAWPSIVFLAFMIPLPFGVASYLAGPLQRFATVVSTFLLQSFGLPALAENNVILLSEVEMGIVEACSGLRMLVVFFALSTAFALLVERPLWEKVVIVVSAVPIALASNVIRITATGMLHEAVSSGGILDGVVSRDLPNVIFHDLAGWLMMPLGLAMLWLELKVLKLLWLDDPEAAEGGRPAPLPPAPPPARSRRAWQPVRSSRAVVGSGAGPAGAR